MRIKTYNLICNSFFWIKTLFALLCATGGLAYLSFKVFDLKIKARDPFINSSFDSGRSLNALEPPSPYIYLGFSINWVLTQPSKISLDGKRPILYDYTPEFSLSNINFYDSSNLMNYAKQVRQVGGILQLTIVPDSTEQFVYLNTIPDRALEMLASDCEAINRMGIPVFLNFAPDMNANYHKYRLNPVAYKEGFRKMTNAIRSKSLVHTVMVWTPSVGYDYPNIGEPANMNEVPLAELDTSKDGKLGPEDDPYGPFYPGADFVDWVGLANNWIPNMMNMPNARNGPPPAGYYEGILNGNQDFLARINSAGTTANLNFYGRFAGNKPMILSQVGVGVESTVGNKDEIIEYKSTIWSQMLTASFLNQFQNLKGIVLNEAEREYKNTKRYIDFRVLENPTYEPFINRISSDDVRTYLPYVGILKSDKNGKIYNIDQIAEQ